MTLGKNDQLLGMDIAKDDADLFVITEQGRGKRTPISQYPVQARGGKGVRTIKAGPKREYLAGEKVVKENHELIIVSNEGIVLRVPVGGISTMSRNTQGVKIMGVKDADKVSALARIVIDEAPQEKEAK